jgi:predicted molibdopterin-dependent oxidoreductase YjgC
MSEKSTAQDPTPGAPQPQMTRLVERERPALAFSLDGASAMGQEGDTILTAVLTLRAHLSQSEFEGDLHAGFCLMGACQECWVTADGAPVRACGTLVTEGMRVTTDRRAAGE